MPKFHTHYERERSKPEVNSREIIVETAGYIPAKQRIESIIRAGERLKVYRKEQFDFNEKIDEDFSDPTRSKNYDLADATAAQQYLDQKSKALAEITRQAASEASRKATEEQKVAQPDLSPEKA